MREPQLLRHSSRVHRSGHPMYAPAPSMASSSMAVPLVQHAEFVTGSLRLRVTPGAERACTLPTTSPDLARAYLQAVQRARPGAARGGRRTAVVGATLAARGPPCALLPPLPLPHLPTRPAPAPHDAPGCSSSSTPPTTTKSACWPLTRGCAWTTSATREQTMSTTSGAAGCCTCWVAMATLRSPTVRPSPSSLRVWRRARASCCR